MATLRPAVFVDRDVLLEMASDGVRGAGARPRFGPFLLRRQAAFFIRGLNELGYLPLVLADHPDLARGRLTLERLTRMNEQFQRELAHNGATVAGLYWCPHDVEADPAERAGKDPAGRAGKAGGTPTPCACHRPAPGLLLEAAARHRVDLARSFMVGGGLADIEAGRRAGVGTILLAESGSVELLERIHRRPQARPDHVATHLRQALAWIERVRELGART